MRIIAESRIREFCRQYPDAEAALLTFAAVTKKAAWRSLQDLRTTYRTADAVEVDSGRMVTVLNIRGNNYRLIVAPHYNTGCLYVMRFLTHAEYSRNTWKRNL